MCSKCASSPDAPADSKGSSKDKDGDASSSSDDVVEVKPEKKVAPTINSLPLAMSAMMPGFTPAPAAGMPPAFPGAGLPQMQPQQQPYVAPQAAPAPAPYVDIPPPAYTGPGCPAPGPPGSYEIEMPPQHRDIMEQQPAAMYDGQEGSWGDSRSGQNEMPNGGGGYRSRGRYDAGGPGPQRYACSTVHLDFVLNVWKKS